MVEEREIAFIIVVVVDIAADLIASCDRSADRRRRRRQNFLSFVVLVFVKSNEMLLLAFYRCLTHTHTHTRGENSFDTLNKLRKLFRVLDRDFLPYLLIKVKVRVVSSCLYPHKRASVTSFGLDIRILHRIERSNEGAHICCTPIIPS